MTAAKGTVLIVIGLLAGIRTLERSKEVLVSFLAEVIAVRRKRKVAILLPQALAPQHRDRQIRCSKRQQTSEVCGCSLLLSKTTT